jgi:hypothetical protein
MASLVTASAAGKLLVGTTVVVWSTSGIGQPHGRTTRDDDHVDRPCAGPCNAVVVAARHWQVPLHAP